MILILNISDLADPIVNILTVAFSQDPKNLKVIGPLVVAIYSFFIDWSAAFAVYTYMLLKSIKESSFFNYKRFFIPAFTICLFFTLFFPATYSLHIFLYPFTLISRVTLGIRGEEIAFSVHRLSAFGYLPKGSPTQAIIFIVFNGLGHLLPILITSYYYFQVYRMLKVQSLMITYSKTTTTRMSWYPLIPIICFGPGALLEIIFTSRASCLPFWASLVVNILHRCWGFLNLLAFWVFKPSTNDRTESLLAFDNEPSSVSEKLIKHQSLEL